MTHSAPIQHEVQIPYAQGMLAGLDQRICEISKMLELYNKDSHKDALVSGYILKNRISTLTQEHPIATKVFQASAIDSKAILKNINQARWLWSLPMFPMDNTLIGRVPIPMSY